ncbi:MAG: hypothetical protein V4850_08420 [Myxococcota bacterium]
MKTTRSQALLARRQELRAKIARSRRSVATDKRDRPLRWPLLLLLLLLLLLVCTRPPPPPEAAPLAAPAAATPAPAAPALPTGRVARRDRPRFESPAPEPLPWLSSFRLQVAARSPRLAECFAGAPRPGALKWTAAVEPLHGRVSQHTVEPTLSSDELSGTQRACVLAVLTEPPYRLEAGKSPSTPSRVGMVIEF